MRARRLYFRDHGAVSSDHAHMDPGTARLPLEDARRLYSQARGGTIGEADAVALRRHLLGDQARLAAEDGLVMTLHPAVYRNHSEKMFQKFGPDVGFDIPVAVDFVHHVAPMLNDVGHDPTSHPAADDRRDRVLPRDRPPSRRVPLGVRRPGGRSGSAC